MRRSNVSIVCRLSLVALACASGSAWAAAAEIRPESMPISKNWKRSFASAETLPAPAPARRLIGSLQTAVPRAMPVAQPRGGPGSIKIDINHCTLAELQGLPGVDASTGARLMAGRPFRDFDDLSRDGIPLNVIDQIRPLVTFGP